MTCRICGKVLERTQFTPKGHATLIVKHRDHLKQHKKQDISCGCDIKFASLAEKLRHIKIEHESFIQCPKCPKTLSNKENLEKHLELHYERQCNSCNFITDSHDAL